ncbi:hypothetical protein FCV82_12670, partial [Vibrio breoganii]|uniref:hypothetical protein n=1 Tax=Vibrio breoganii TaxID=553239 RepID=UPI0010BD0D9A
LITKTIEGKEVRLLTSMTDSMRYPGKDIAELYSHRWEQGEIANVFYTNSGSILRSLLSVIIYSLFRRL